MADLMFHFGCGIAAGTVAGLPAVLRHARPPARVSTIAAAWLLSAWAVGLWAIAPSLLRAIGLPSAISAAPCMNIFFFHPLLDRLENGGMLKGEMLTSGAFLLQYLTLVWLIALRNRAASGHQV